MKRALCWKYRQGHPENELMEEAKSVHLEKVLAEVIKADQNSNNVILANNTNINYFETIDDLDYEFAIVPAAGLNFVSLQKNLRPAECL